MITNREFEKLFRIILKEGVSPENWKEMEDQVDMFIKKGVCREESRSDVLNAIFVQAFIERLDINAFYMLNRMLAPEEVDRATDAILKVLREKRLGV